MKKTVKKSVLEFCWVDLVSNNLLHSLEFYRNLFNWKTEKYDMPNGHTYFVISLNGYQIGGALQITQKMSDEGTFPYWRCYVAVNSIDEVLRKAMTLGATILKEPFFVLESGRRAIIQDPTNAILPIWQARDEFGEQPIYTTPGMYCWNELITNDLTKSSDFYYDLFDWKAESRINKNRNSYAVFMKHDQSVSGISIRTKQLNIINNGWLVYFTSANLMHDSKKIESMSGKIFYGPKKIPSMGYFGIYKDPEGAIFSLIEFEKKKPGNRANGIF